MAHDHHHHHGESASNYFTEQLLTILVCGLIGYAGIEMYRTDRLGFLATKFQLPVLIGGIVILVLVVLRSIAVWREAGEMQAHLQACAQDHVHTADCDHDHDHGHSHGPDEEHDHEHSHDMSWLFARMLILVFPVLLYFIGLPTSGFSKERQLQLAGNDAALGTESLKKFLDGATVIEGPKEDKGATVRVFKTASGLKIREMTPLKGGDTKLELISEAGTPRKFNELNDAALNEGKRKYMEGETVILEGRFKQLADKEFSLFRMKMTCCAADTVPLKVRIIVPQALSNFSDFDWVTVKGQLQFLRVQGQDRFIPVIMVANNRDVAKTPPKSEYEQ
jgi:hypothetical protein